MWQGNAIPPGLKYHIHEPNSIRYEVILSDGLFTLSYQHVSRYYQQNSQNRLSVISPAFKKSLFAEHLTNIIVLQQIKYNQGTL